MYVLHLDDFFEYSNYSTTMEENYKIPVQYHLTRAILQVKDPFHLYLYWEFDRESTRFIEETIGSLRVIKVRLHNTTEINFNGYNSVSYAEYDGAIGPFGRYLDLVSPNATYVAQVGFYDSNSSYQVVVTSNFVTTPRAEASEILDERWMTIEELFHLHNLRSSFSSHSMVETSYLNNNSGSSINF